MAIMFTRVCSMSSLRGENADTDVDHGAEQNHAGLRHALLKAKLGGIFIRPDLVQGALEAKPDLQPAVMDIGTGSGTWACEMANMFPGAHVVGLDLVPTPFIECATILPFSRLWNLTLFLRSPPANCRFECDNVDWGLPHYKNCFNVVHARFICTSLNNYHGLLEDAALILRPGGVFLSMEGDMQLYNEHKEKVLAEEPGEPGFFWLQKYFRIIATNPKASHPMSLSYAIGLIVASHC